MSIRLENNFNAVGIDLESATGLRIVTEHSDNDDWYHISGTMVNQPGAKGIYIRNGGKYVVK